MNLEQLVKELDWMDGTMSTQERRFTATDIPWGFEAVHRWRHRLFTADEHTYEFTIDHHMREVQKFEGEQGELLYNLVLQTWERQQEQRKIARQREFRQKFGELEV